MTKDRIKEALIPAFLTLLIFSGVLLAKGIFPFGSLRIDYYDMGQTNAPLYYHIWDFLHGKGGLFYSWYIDEAQNLSMGSSIQWNISVFNLFFLLVKRSAVMKSLSIFMGLHLFFMAFNMDLFLGRVTDTPRSYRMLFALSYGLTGFTLTHYTIPTYLDTAALMPLYLMTLHGVLKGREHSAAEGGASSPADGEIRRADRIKRALKNPVLIYALMTGYMTGLGYYMAFMNLIFILLVSGTYIFLLSGTDESRTDSEEDAASDIVIDRAEKKKRRARAVGSASLRLGLGTFAGIGLSSFMLIPAACQMMKSSRFNSNLSGGLFSTLHDILWAIGADMYYIKWWLLSGSIFAIVILICGMVHFRREIRVTLFFFLFCMYPTALIVFESINLLWHMGTYYHYPIRCGYLIPIVLLTTAAYYAGRFETEADTGEAGKEAPGSGGISISRNSRPVLAIFGIAAAACDTALIFYYTGHGVWEIKDLFNAWVIFALILALVYFVLFAIIKRPAYAAPVLIMELALTSFIGYGQPNFTDRFSSDPEQSGDYVVTAQTLSDELGISESRIDRIKNPDTTLNTNYGFVLRRATVGGWANTVPRPQMDSAIALGYGAHFMRILDCGGSLLSDAMLHVTETVTVSPELYTEEAWEQEGLSGDYTLLKNKYTLPFIMKTTADEASLLDPLAGKDFCDATNAAYGFLSPDEKESKDQIVRDITEDVRSGSFHADGKKALYLYGGSFTELMLDGRVVPVPDIGDPGGTSYPAWFNSAALFLGIHEDKDVEIEGDYDGDTRFFEFDVDKLESLCSSYSGEAEEINVRHHGLDITMQAHDGEYALIPLAYDDGYTAKTNGAKAEIINVSDVFIAIPLTEGEDHITLDFSPAGGRVGIMISIFIFFAIALCALYPMRVRAAEEVSAYVLAFLFGAFVIALYLIPYIAFIIHQIEKRLL